MARVLVSVGGVSAYQDSEGRVSFYAFQAAKGPGRRQGEVERARARRNRNNQRMLAYLRAS